MRSGCAASNRIPHGDVGILKHMVEGPDQAGGRKSAKDGDKDLLKKSLMHGSNIIHCAGLSPKTPLFCLHDIKTKNQVGDGVCEDA